MDKQESLHNFSEQNERPFDRAPDIDEFFFDINSSDHAKLLHTEGLLKLQNGDSSGIELLENAERLAPENVEMFIRQGKALLHFGKGQEIKKYILLANKKFKLATKLDGEDFFAWKQWGDSLLFLGETYKDFHFFLDAKDKFEKAIKYSQLATKEESADLFWKYGIVLKEIATHSEEVSDLHASMESFARAAALNCNLPNTFWICYGHIALQMGKQINDTKLYARAIEYHKYAVNLLKSDFDAWYALAYTLTHLYYITHDEDHFSSANECFTNAAKLHPQNDHIWLTWAKLLLSSGKRLKDTKRLHACIEKCHRSYTLGSNKEKTLSLWAQALAKIGEIQERLELLNDAQNKVTEGIEAFGATVEMCFAHGATLFSMGKFFQDNDYFYQSIEKFQEGLSLDSSNQKLWFYLGYAFATIAEEENDPQLFERSSKFYLRALNIKIQSTYLYEYAKCLAKRAEFNRDLTLAESSLLHFEQAFSMQKNAVFVHPEWLFAYAMSLDLMGDLSDEASHYTKAIEILQRTLMLDPDFPKIHYHLGIVYSHLGELLEDERVMHKALSHFKISHGEDDESETNYLDWGLALINLSQMTHQEDEAKSYLEEAEYKLIQAAKLGNTEAYYHLCSLCSLTERYENAIYFLEKAKQFEALPPIDEILEDDWMENLRNTSFFTTFISQLN